MFTKEQILEIEKALQARSVKDSEFSSAENVNGLEKIPILQNNENKLLSVENLASYIINYFGTFVLTVKALPVDSKIYINNIETNILPVLKNTTATIVVTAEGYESFSTQVEMTSNKIIQIELTPISKKKFLFSVLPYPQDSIVELNEIESKSIVLDENAQVNWSVSKLGYLSKTGTDIATSDKIISVKLDPNPELYVTFTINLISPEDAIVTINGQNTTSVTILKGDEVSWSVIRNGYISQGNTEIINEDTVKNITLVKEKYTLTIVPTPSDAVVKLNNEVRSSIEVDYETMVSIEVSKEGYITHEEEYKVTKTESKEISLTEIVETSWSDLVLSQGDSSENPINTVPQAGGNISIKAMVTVHFNDSSTESRDVTSQIAWTVSGEGCTSNNDGTFTWSNNDHVEQRTATITGKIEDPEGTELSKIIKTTQIGSDEYLIISPETMTFEAAGGTQELTITSNNSWTLS